MVDTKQPDRWQLCAVAIAGVVVGVAVALCAHGVFDFSGLSFQTLIQTLATVVSGLGASLAAYVALHVANEEKRRRATTEKEQAFEYLYENRQVLSDVLAFVNSHIENQRSFSDHRDRGAFAAELKRRAGLLASLDLRQAATISIDLKKVMRKIQALFLSLQVESNVKRIKSAERALESALDEREIQKLQDISVLIDAVIGGVDEHMTGVNSGLHRFTQALHDVSSRQA